MNKPASLIIPVLTIAALAVLSCEPAPTSNSAPTITALTLPTEVDAGVDATFSCTATDPDSEALAYNWTCSSGLLQSATGSTVVWTAPETSGTAAITVTVFDDSGASDTASGTVTVKPVTTTIVDWSGVVAAGDYELQTRYIWAGHAISGSFSAAGQTITFLVLDSINYPGWRGSQSYSALVKVDSSPGSDFSAVIPADGNYHFILDNMYNTAADTAVHLLVQRTSP